MPYHYRCRPNSLPYSMAGVILLEGNFKPSSIISKKDNRKRVTYSAALLFRLNKSSQTVPHEPS